MSHFMPLTLSSGKFINQKVLAAALRNLNFQPEVTESGQQLQLVGYYGNEQETAEIVLRRNTLKFHCYSDIGFRLNSESGEYELVADDMLSVRTESLKSV